MTRDSCRSRLLLIGLALVTLLASTACSEPAAGTRHLLIVVDGLRPDYVSPDVMPHLYALGQRGVVFTQHHSVYPTVTRVNAASISTGAYPEAHGLMANWVFFPQLDPAGFLNTSDRMTLMRIGRTGADGLLTSDTLGEALQSAGKKMLVVSSGSTGTSLLLNHTVAGGAIFHHEYALPAGRQRQMQAQLGKAPPPHAPDGALDQRAVDAFLKLGLPTIQPSVTVMWLSDLDAATHAHGIGHSTPVAILRRVDGLLTQIEAGMRSAGVLEMYNIWVTSDHGFSTATRGVDIGQVVNPFSGKLPDGSPRVVTDGETIYVRDGNAAIVSAIVHALQRTPGVGAIFTRGAQRGGLDGHVPGTLSFGAARWDHQRSGDILFSPDWTDARNTRGFPGTIASDAVAGHGSSSPFDIHNTLIAAGPDLKKGIVIDVPSGNVDFAPTLLRLLGIPAPASMQGRVLDEAFTGGPEPQSARMRSVEHSVKTADGSYVLTVSFSTIESGGRSYRYLDRTTVERAAAPASDR
jgi:predicted AlkP superfamily pyrophosphatase or phosphodiesterase